VDERLEFYKSGATPRKNVDVMQAAAAAALASGDSDSCVSVCLCVYVCECVFLLYFACAFCVLYLIQNIS
jgi:hypothetical protein